MTLLATIPIGRRQHAAALATERLLLRAPKPEDAQSIARLANDRRIA